MGWVGGILIFSYIFKILFHGIFRKNNIFGKKCMMQLLTFFGVITKLDHFWGSFLYIIYMLFLEVKVQNGAYIFGGC